MDDHRSRWPLICWAVMAGLGAGSGCNDHPLTPIEDVFVFANDKTVTVPAKIKLDFLFMIDNSGSMAEEQANLGTNFASLSRYLFDNLGTSADFRIAVVNTDMRSATAKGRFQDAPAALPPNGPPCPPPDYVPPVPLDCEDLLIDPASDRRWTFGPILKSGRPEDGGNIGASREALEHRFQCLATLGTTGDGFEKGLEAIRTALSCEGVGGRNGPNAENFGRCCVDDLGPDGRKRGRKYDRNCASHLRPGESPDFLRPDAMLIVVILSDEVDCSDPASNPEASHRAICRHKPSADAADAEIPSGFDDPVLCPGGDPAACYRRECGALPPAQCYTARCEIGRDHLDDCAWRPQALTPVEDYVHFLSDLKVDPNNDIIVASIVGRRAMLALDDGRIVPARFVPGEPAEACWAYESQCVAGPDGVEQLMEVPNPERSEIRPDCCPDGACTGAPVHTCLSANGAADDGTRYLELAEAFGINGIGCSAADEAAGQCLTICEDDFTRPLEIIRDRINDNLGTYCLDAQPKCMAPGEPDEPLRDCETPAEFEDIANFKSTLRVRKQCLHTQETGGACPVLLPVTDLASSEFDLHADASCPSRLAVTLRERPSPGAEVFLQFRVAATADDAYRAPPEPDGGVILFEADAGVIILEADAAP